MNSPQQPTEPLSYEPLSYEPPAPGRPSSVPEPRVPSQSAVGAIRAIGVVTVLGLLALSAFAVITQFFEQRTHKTDLITAPFSRLVTDVSVGDVVVRAGQAGQPARVVRTETWAFGSPTSSVSTSGDALRVTGRCPLSAFIGHCSVDLDVTVPPGTTLELLDRTGDLRAIGLTGTVTATTSTGDIVLTDLNGPSVRARTSTGDVTVTSDASTAADVRVDSSTGDLRLRFTGVAPQTVSAHTSTGDVSVYVPDSQRYQVTLNTSTGTSSSDVVEDPASSHRIDARTSTGDVRIRPS